MADPDAPGGVQRRAPRRKLFEVAELRHGTEVQRIHLLDLSVAGALVHVAEPPAAGTLVKLVCGSINRMARVAWASDRRIGLTFIRPLIEADVEALVGGSG